MKHESFGPPTLYTEGQVVDIVVQVFLLGLVIGVLLMILAISFDA